MHHATVEKNVVDTIFIMLSTWAILMLVFTAAATVCAFYSNNHKPLEEKANEDQSVATDSSESCPETDPTMDSI